MRLTEHEPTRPETIIIVPPLITVRRISAIPTQHIAFATATVLNPTIINFELTCSGSTRDSDLRSPQPLPPACPPVRLVRSAYSVPICKYLGSNTLRVSLANFTCMFAPACLPPPRRCRRSVVGPGRLRDYSRVPTCPSPYIGSAFCSEPFKSTVVATDDGVVCMCTAHNLLRQSALSFETKIKKIIHGSVADIIIIHWRIEHSLFAVLRSIHIRRYNGGFRQKHVAWMMMTMMGNNNRIKIWTRFTTIRG